MAGSIIPSDTIEIVSKSLGEYANEKRGCVRVVRTW